MLKIENLHFQYQDFTPAEIKVLVNNWFSINEDTNNWEFAEEVVRILRKNLTSEIVAAKEVKSPEDLYDLLVEDYHTIFAVISPLVEEQVSLILTKVLGEAKS